MNELELIKNQLTEINNKRVKYNTLKEQALKQCKEIEQKYGVKSVEELKVLVDKAQAEYEKTLKDAKTYIEKTNKILESYQGVI